MKMKKEILIIIANKLIELRNQKNLTQNELCNKLNIKRATYSNWETARVEIPLETLDIIANFYNVGINYIFDLSTNKKHKEYKTLNFEILAQRLTEYKKEKKLKLEALAIDAGTTPSTIWAYLNNKNKILTSYLYNICKSNNLSADYLLGKTNNPEY